jgi:hypothetical protein
MDIGVQVSATNKVLWITKGLFQNLKKGVNLALGGPTMNHLHYRLNFDLDKCRQNFHHSLKEHHKISNIPKFRCEML